MKFMKLAEGSVHKFQTQRPLVYDPLYIEINQCKFLFQHLSDLLAEEANRLQDSYPVIKHTHLLQIVRRANLDLDEEELQQV